jgi:hypothetical protein
VTLCPGFLPEFFHGVVVLNTLRKIASTHSPPFVWPRPRSTQAHLLTAKLLDSNEGDNYCRAAEALEAGHMRTARSLLAWSQWLKE